LLFVSWAIEQADVRTKTAQHVSTIKFEALSRLAFAIRYSLLAIACMAFTFDSRIQLMGLLSSVCLMGPTVGTPIEALNSSLKKNNNNNTNKKRRKHFL